MFIKCFKKNDWLSKEYFSFFKPIEKKIKKMPLFLYFSLIEEKNLLNRRLYLKCIGYYES